MPSLSLADQMKYNDERNQRGHIAQDGTTSQTA